MRSRERRSSFLIIIQIQLGAPRLADAPPLCGVRLPLNGSLSEEHGANLCSRQCTLFSTLTSKKIRGKKNISGRNRKVDVAEMVLYLTTQLCSRQCTLFLTLMINHHCSRRGQEHQGLHRTYTLLFNRISYCVALCWMVLLFLKIYNFANFWHISVSTFDLLGPG